MISSEAYYLRLLELGHFEQRSRGGRRFGIRVLDEEIVDRLIAAGRVEVVNERVELKHQPSNS